MHLNTSGSFQRGLFQLLFVFAFGISLVSTLSYLTNKCLSGANTDLLGRRWFLVGGNLICFIGHIVVGTAKTPNAIIAGMTITGFGAANCQMAAFALTELLPNKWRHIGRFCPGD